MRNFKNFIFICCLPLLTTFACKNTGSVKPTPSITAISPMSTPAPQIISLNNSEQLTFVGDNRQPKLSADNSRLLFTSRQRSQHKGSQIYEINMVTNKEERLTFNDNHCFDPNYLEDNNQIIFSSNTDETKEAPNQANPNNHTNLTLPFDFVQNLEAFQLTEIYSLVLNNKTNIPERLSKHSGLDAMPVPLSKNEIAWIQKDNKMYSLVKSATTRNQITEICKQVDMIWKPTANSAQTQWLWISWGDSGPNTNTEVKTFWAKTKILEVLRLPRGIYHDANWTPVADQLILSAQLQGAKDFDIFLYDLKTQCLRPIVQNAGDDIEPTINKKNSFLVFAHRTLQQNGSQFQLFKKSLNSVLEPCVPIPN